MALIALLLALLLPAFGHAEPGSVGTDQFLGLDDTNPPASLQPGQASAALNVESSLSGNAIIKRGGFAQTAQMTISTSAVTGAYQFVDTNGNIQTVVCNDTRCSNSVNGGNFTDFITTATNPGRWSFVDINGSLYGVNDANDQPFSWNGTTLLQPLSTSAPLGSLIELSKDRMIISGVKAFPNRVYYSQSGVYTNYTTGLNSSDPWTDDFGSPGDKVTAVKWDNGRVYIFKRQSITACLLQDQYSTYCYPVSSVVGTNAPQAIVSTPGGLYFQSQNGSYWLLSEYSGLQPISKQISNFVKSQVSIYGSNGSGNNTQGAQTDWQAGTQFPAQSWNTSIIPGSVFPSSVTFTDSSVLTFSSGTAFFNISTTDISGISLSSSVFSDSWSNNLSAGRLAWTTTSGSWAASANALSDTASGATDLNNSINTSSVTLSSGSWRFSHSFSNSNTGAPQTLCSNNGLGNCFEFKFMKNGGGNYFAAVLADGTFSASTPKNVRLIKSIAGVKTVLSGLDNKPYSSYSVNQTHSWEIDRSTDGRMFLYLDSVFVSSTPADNSISSSTRIEISGTSNVGAVTKKDLFSSVYAYQYPSSGTFISRSFDTSFSTPIFGTFNSTFSVAGNIEGQVNFYTQVSTSPNNDLWDAKIASSDTLRVASAAKRYVRYEADLITFFSTKTPTVTAASLVAATTGQFVEKCIQPGSGISSWGQLNCDLTTAGAGSIVFYATSAATCANLPTTAPQWTTPKWTQQTNNTKLTISTNAAVSIGWVSLLGSATDQAQVNACTLNWNNGTVPQTSFGVYDPVRNAVFWDTAINNSTYNNRVLKYDLNLNQWYPFDLQALAMRMVNNTLYFGSSSSGTWNSYATAGVTTDNGNPINSFWTTKDFAGADPFRESQWLRAFIVPRNSLAGSITASISTSLAGSDTWSIAIGTSTSLDYVRSGHSIVNMGSAPFLSLTLSNFSSNPWEVDGIKFDYETKDFNFVNP